MNIPNPVSIASLPMYDLPEVRPALDRLWRAIADRLIRDGLPAVPERLVHDRPLAALWSDPALFLSQCCGHDIVHRYAGKLRPIAAPRYGAPGCVGGDYASIVVVADHLAGRELAALEGTVCAINGYDSHSGTHALRALIAPIAKNGRFFAEVKVSGTHADSLAMIARGEAEVAAIDCVTYALLAAHRPAALAGSQAICRTPPAPGIPFVTRADAAPELVERLQAALVAAFEAPALAEARRVLFFEGLELRTVEDYAPMREIERSAVGHGYAELR